MAEAPPTPLPDLGLASPRLSMASAPPPPLPSPAPADLGLPSPHAVRSARTPLLPPRRLGATLLAQIGPTPRPPAHASPSARDKTLGRGEAGSCWEGVALPSLDFLLANGSDLSDLMDLTTSAAGHQFLTLPPLPTTRGPSQLHRCTRSVLMRARPPPVLRKFAAGWRPRFVVKALDPDHAPPRDLAALLHRMDGEDAIFIHFEILFLSLYYRESKCKM